MVLVYRAPFFCLLSTRFNGGGRRDWAFWNECMEGHAEGPGRSDVTRRTTYQVLKQNAGVGQTKDGRTAFLPPLMIYTRYLVCYYGDNGQPLRSRACT